MTKRTKRTIAAITLLAVVGVGVWFNQRGGATAKDLDAAEAALRRHAPLAARPHLDRVLAAKPNHADALLLAAKAARRCDDYAAAERHLSAFEGLSGSSEASRLEWTLLGVQQGDFWDDEERMKTAVSRRHPESIAILEALAKGYNAAFRWPEATVAVNGLLDREPDHVPALVLRAALTERARKMSAAEEDLRRAVAAAPSNPLAQFALADNLNLHGFTREAIAHYELARSLNRDAATRIGLARAIADTGQVGQALQELEGVAADDPKSAEALVERGRLLLRLKKPADAEPLLTTATRLAPWHRDGHKFLLAALKELGRTADAAKCEARVAELDREDSEGGRMKLKARDTPGEPNVRLALAAWAVRNGQPEEEVAWLAEILRAAPKHPAAHAAFADYFNRTGQHRRAGQHRGAAHSR